MSSLFLTSLLTVLFFPIISTESAAVIVIGAGPAGIAAATRLLNNQIDDILILEAENRTGGRVNSIKFGDAIVDLGAEYCHGEKGNIVYQMVKDKDLLDRIDRWQTDLFYSNGSLIEAEEILKMVSIYEQLPELLVNETDDNISTGDLILKKYQSPEVEKYLGSAIDPGLHKLLDESKQLAENIVLGLEGAFSWFSTSAKSHYEECEGNQALTWKGRGYRTILDMLMGSYPDPKQKLPIDNKILLNKKVVKISTDQPLGVTVTTEDNSTYTADFVIFTPSIGVLKKQQNLFSPNLPAYKSDALKAIGLDGVMKIIVRFSQKWWKDGINGISLFWSEEDKKSSGKDFPLGPIKNGVSWITHISYLGPQPPDINPNVAILWVLGDIIPELELESEETIRKGVDFVLRKFLGRHYNVTGIDEIIWSKWCTNPNFLGTYSFLKTGFYNANISYNEQLSKPILDEKSGKPKLLFAGEATNPVHYSTVHGAIETGFREADRILESRKITI